MLSLKSIQDNFSIENFIHPFVLLVGGFIFFYLKDIKPALIAMVVWGLSIILLKAVGAKITTGKLITFVAIQFGVGYLVAKVINLGVINLGILSLDIIGIILGSIILKNVFKEIDFSEAVLLNVIFEVIGGLAIYFIGG